MSLTRVTVEKILVKRCGQFMTAAALATTIAGSNDDCSDPMAWAMRQLGYSPTAVDSVTDGDLVQVASSRTDAFLDLAELRLLETIRGNLTSVNARVGPLAEDKSALLNQITALVEKKSSEVSARHGNLLTTPLDGSALVTVGMISL